MTGRMQSSVRSSRLPFWLVQPDHVHYQCRFVLENSGVAEPQNLRDKFNDALASGYPLMSRIRLDTMVTMVDSGSFFADWSSKAPLAARPDLGEGGNLRPVVDLLVEQIECASALLLAVVNP